MFSEVDDNARSVLQSYVDADALAIPTTSHLVTASGKFAILYGDEVCTIVS